MHPTRRNKCVAKAAASKAALNQAWKNFAESQDVADGIDRRLHTLLSQGVRAVTRASQASSNAVAEPCSNAAAELCNEAPAEPDDKQLTLEESMMRVEYKRIEEESAEWNSWYISRKRKAHTQSPDELRAAAASSVRRMMKRGQSSSGLAGVQQN